MPDKCKPHIISEKPLLDRLGYHHLMYCPQCGKFLTSWYDSQLDFDDLPLVTRDFNYCYRCGTHLDLDEYKDMSDDRVPADLMGSAPWIDPRERRPDPNNAEIKRLKKERDEQTALANEYRKKALGYYCELRNQELGCEHEDCFLCDAVFEEVDIND